MKAILIAIGLTSLSSSVIANDMAPTPSSLVQCTVCHGSQLMGNPGTGAPRLAGLPTWYVTRQLESFQKRWRGQHPEDHSGAEMLPVAMSTTASQLRDLQGWLPQLAPKEPEATLTGDASQGAQLYESCGSCHGTAAQGNQALGAPALAGQSDWYLLKQLRYFKAGIRGSEPKDLYGQQMRAAAQQLTGDNAMRDVVTFISSLPTQKELTP